MQLSKAKISYLNSLKQKKFRQKYNNFLVEGDKSVRELLSRPTSQIENIYALDSWINDYPDLTEKWGNKLINIKQNELRKISQLTTPNQVLVVAKQFEESWKHELAQCSLSLFLDNIQDPGNLGTILRIADWFAIPYVFRSAGCVDIYNSKVIQASMGAFMRVKSPKIELSEIKMQLPDTPILGALMEGENVFTLSGLKSGILVIGNEGKGISKENIELLSQKITIPAPQGSGAESLNAGVATGIIVSHLLKN